MRYEIEHFTTWSDFVRNDKECLFISLVFSPNSEQFIHLLSRHRVRGNVSAILSLLEINIVVVFFLNEIIC